MEMMLYVTLIVIIACATQLVPGIAFSESSSDNGLPYVEVMQSQFGFDVRPLPQQFYRNFSETFEVAMDIIDRLVADGDVEAFLDVIRTVPNDISDACFKDSETVIKDLGQFKEYALRFLDAQAKIPYGILQGQWIWTGDYHECIEIQSDYNPLTNHSFQGRYWSVDVAPLNIGVCTPDSCSKHDVSVLMAPVARAIHSEVKHVYSTHRRPFETTDFITLAVCGAFVGMVVLGTFLDYKHSMSKKEDNKATECDEANTHINNSEDKVSSSSADTENLIANNLIIVTPHPPSFLVRILTSFSCFSNTRRLCITSTSEHMLLCLNGLRVLSMCWVITGHTFLLSGHMSKDPLNMFKKLYRGFASQILSNFTYSVDIFFFMSGLLCVFVAMKEISAKGRINWIHYWLHRYMRLTPTLAFVLMIWSTVYGLIATGPFRAGLDDNPHYFECGQYWWTLLLYINNFYPHGGPTQTCMGISWYLANDIQMFAILGPIVIISLHRKPKFGYCLSTVLILVCLISRGLTIDYFGINPNGAPTKHVDNEWANGSLYTKPYNRWSVFVVGMMTGYFLKTTHGSVRMNKIVVVCGWLLSTATCLAILFGVYSYNNHHDDGMPGGILYNTCGRTAWSLAMAWIVIACTTGYGGWVNAILSWKHWAPLARLTFGVYLVHPMVVLTFFLNAVSPLQYSFIVLMTYAVTNIILSFALSYVVSMMIEAPFLNLEKLVRSRQ